MESSANGSVIIDIRLNVLSRKTGKVFMVFAYSMPARQPIIKGFEISAFKVYLVR